ncbi:MAG: hypothetical protein WCT50_05120 [Patescibacteria group bacterium]
MKNNIKIKYFQSGVTIIELLVSMSVIVFITAIFVANYNSTNKRTDLIMASQSLVADFHYAQNNSLGLLKYGDVVPAGGWGLNFNLSQKDRYVIFADLDGPGTLGYMVYNSDEGEFSKGARTVILPSGTEISSLRFFGNITKPLVNVTFLPPDPKTNISSGSATSTVLEIDILELRTGVIKTVKVNFLGLAEVIN